MCVCACACERTCTLSCMHRFGCGCEQNEVFRVFHSKLSNSFIVWNTLALFYYVVGSKNFLHFFGIVLLTSEIYKCDISILYP
jgi:hypothetical protein